MTRQKTALVTGASSGIGYAVSKELALKGYKVFAVARRTEPMESLKQYGVIPKSLDVTSQESVQLFKKYLLETLEDGKLDILYNNAGQSCTLPAIDVTDDQVEQVFQVNVFACIRLTREFSPFVIKAKGTILFTGSLAGVAQFPFGSVYSATKGAIHQYARVLHLEMKPLGVRVINVITGGVNTNIADTRKIPENSLYNTPEGAESFEMRQRLAKENTPMEASVYAKSIVKDIQSSRDPIDVYRGTYSTMVPFLIRWFPGWFVELVFIRRFKLGRMFDSMKKKNTDEVDLHLD